MTRLNERRLCPFAMVATLVLIVLMANSVGTMGQSSIDVELEITPSSPTPSDALRITVLGTWRNACVPQNPQTTVEGNEITIATSVERALCAEVLTDFSFTVELGTLEAGAYQVTVTYRQADRDPEVIARGGFDVQAPSRDPCNYDTNENGVIDDAELIDAINDWVAGVVSDRVLRQLIDWWIAGTAACADSP